MKYASLIVLSYNRKAFLQRSLESLWAHTTYPYQLIICDDASDAETQDYIYSLVRARKVSTVLLNSGHNMGIGTAVNRGIAAAWGDYLLKLDADLIYRPGWLHEVVHILDHPEVGSMGLFAYHHPPRVFEKDIIRDHGAYYEMVDYVGSAVCFRRDIWDKFGPWWVGAEQTFSEDVRFKRTMQAVGYRLALPKHDLCENVGFGEDKTSLIRKIDWEHGKHEYNIPTYAPLLFGGTNA
jgi:glycosyltransferase involved in cell wall biosynthesis